ncbi:MAG: DNA polymerase III subunit beta [Ruminococcaceae bacterium]|nr:DNA polymerase III subunit beta [Oscillospiraceae bacterium]
MKIVFNRQSISEAIAPLMCAVSNKSTVPAIEGILIEAVEPDTCTLTTYDLKMGVQITIHPEVIEGGSYVINAQKFNQTVKVMDGDEVTLTVDDKLTATFEAGKSTHKMNALRGSDFPEIPRILGNKGFVVNQAVLKKMISKVSHAMGVNDQRPVLNGCYFKIVEDNLLTVACDGFRLAKCAISTEMTNAGDDGVPMNYSFIVPVKTVGELQRMLLDSEEEDARIFVSRKNILMKLGDLNFFSCLIDGDYIEYDHVILSSHRIGIEVDKNALLSALDRAALITEEKIAGSVRSHVKLQIEGDLLKIFANSTAGSTYDELPIEHEGDDLVIAFNNRYLIDSLRSCTADRVKISLTSALTSINIEPVEKSDDHSELFFLLPVRMKE